MNFCIMLLVYVKKDFEKLHLKIKSGIGGCCLDNSKSWSPHVLKLPKLKNTGLVHLWVTCVYNCTNSDLYPGEKRWGWKCSSSSNAAKFLLVVFVFQDLYWETVDNHSFQQLLVKKKWICLFCKSWQNSSRHIKWWTEETSKSIIIIWRCLLGKEENPTTQLLLYVNSYLHDLI